ncbi:MAG: HAMP domain-containing sensor histidine kinase [Caldilineaceae bacterium]|nr:HAMP domain-containing sensor histidine kinase [Caldilineaceae bacterium]
MRSFPDDLHYELIFFFALVGVVISLTVNGLLLRWALAPLDRLQNAVDAVRGGQEGVRVQLGENSDERFDRLGETFNRMLDAQEANARRMQQLSRQILQAQEDERQRLARELHDEAAQALTGLLVHLRLLERAHTPEEAQQRVLELRTLTAQALEDVRRVALDLRPTILDDLGLAAALEWRVDEVNKMDGVSATFEASGLEQRLARELELVLYRIGQEALSNVVRHAQAQHVAVMLIRHADRVVLRVVDDGIGYDPAALRSGVHHGLGLVGMGERIAMVNGGLTVESRPGQGVTIVATAPIAEPAGEALAPADAVQ